MKKNLVSIILMTVILCNFPIFAEEIILKTGEVIEGEVVSYDDEAIKIKVKYGVISIDKKQIFKDKKREKTVSMENKRKPASKKTKKWVDSVTPTSKLRGMQKWLINQIHPKTQILESFNPTSDMQLRKQAATYDQGLAGIAFLELGAIKKAKEILDFYNKKWKGNGFSNFYFVPTGDPGLESTVHLGPNMWIALLGLHYNRITKSDRYMKLVVSMVKWTFELNHFHGGVAMSNANEWRAPWTEVVSTENNIDYYVVLEILSQRIKDLTLKEKIKNELEGIKNFLVMIAYDRNTGGMFRGYHSGRLDRERALDTITWLVLGIGLKKIDDWGIDILRLLHFMEKRFMVMDQGIKGFDFTDKRGARRAKRDRIISVEWTLEAVNVYCSYQKYYYKLAKANKGKERGELFFMKSKIYRNKAKYYTMQMDKLMLRFGKKRDMCSYPYATKPKLLVFGDSFWWKTPANGNDGTPAGSVASTVWRIFAGRFNPLSEDGKFD